MKKIYTLLTCTILLTGILAQVPQKMSYQAVIRDATGNLLANTPVGVKVSILTGSETGAVVFSETHTKTTNANGLINLVIGEGTYVSGTFSGIDWSTLSYFIKTETDPTGGTNYTISGTSQLMSVPYAFYAGNSYWAQNQNNSLYRYSGNVAIGSFPSDFRLELTQSSNSKGLRIMGGYDTNAKLLSVSSYGNVEVDDHSIEGGRLMIKTGGNVGIGDPNPTERLVVNGKTKTTNLQVTNGASAGKVLTSDTEGNATWQNSNSAWAANGNNLYNTNTGDIGIGTSNPAKYGNTYGKVIELNSEYGSHLILSQNQPSSGNPFGSITWGSNNLTTTDKRIAIIQAKLSNYSTSDPKSNIKFYTKNGSEMVEAFGISETGAVNVSSAGDFLVDKPSSPGGRFRITADGNVGIGNLSPTRPLSFPASLGEKILLFPGATGEVGIGVYANELRIHTDVSNGKVSFGSQDNAGTFTEFGKFEKNGAYALSVFGDIWANGVTYASDERFKKDIAQISSPLNKIKQINGVEYEMKPEFSKMNFVKGRQIGLLAQNIEKVVPEAVVEKDGYKGVDYARLVPLLIESIKEQQKEIETLENRIKDLENK